MTGDDDTRSGVTTMVQLVTLVPSIKLILPILDITKVTHGPVQLQSCLSLFAVGHSQRESHI